MRNLFIVFIVWYQLLLLRQMDRIVCGRYRQLIITELITGQQLPMGGLVSCRGKNRFLFAMSC